MAKYAKLRWMPRYTQALLLDGSHYASLDDAGLNVGVADFALDFMGGLDADTPDSYATIIGKGPAAFGSSWANHAGFALALDPGTRALRLKLNDGNAADGVTVASNGGVFTLGVNFWGRVESDRSGQARFYVNGVDVGGGDISSRAGSLDNTYLVKVGAYDGSHDRFKGRLDLLRLDKGRLLGAPWCAQEWERLRWGWPRQLKGFLELWKFQGSLVGDAVSQRPLLWQGGGSSAFADGWPYTGGPLEVQLSYGRIKWEGENLDLDAVDFNRTLDGTANSYNCFDKRRIVWHLEGIPFSQAMAIRGARLSGELIEVFADVTQDWDMQALMPTPPDLREMVAGFYKGDVEFEEA